MTEKKNKWLILFAICFGGGIVYILPYIQYSYYDSLREALNLDNQQMGNMMSLLGTASAIAYLIGGVFADKFSVRWLISLALAVTGAAGLWFATFPSYTELLIIMVLYALSTVLAYWPAMIKAIKMLGSEAEQGRMFGFREAGFGIFAWIFTQAGAWLIFNRQQGVEGVRSIIIYYSIIYFAAAVVSFILIPDSSKQKIERAVERKAGVINGILYVIRIPAVWMIGITIFFAYSVSGAGLGKLTPYFTGVLGLDETLVASLMSFRMYLLAFLAASFGGIIADKLKSTSKFTIFAYILLLITLLALTLIPAKETVVLLIVIVGFLASAVIYSMKGTYMAPVGQSRIPNEYIGTAIGLVSFIGYLPDAFMFSVFGSMLGDAPGEHEFKAIFWVCVIFAAVGVFTAFLTKKLIDRRQTRISAADVE